jgi:hypothetical protein
MDIQEDWIKLSRRWENIIIPDNEGNIPLQTMYKDKDRLQMGYHFKLIYNLLSRGVREKGTTICLCVSEVVIWRDNDLLVRTPGPEFLRDMSTNRQYLTLIMSEDKLMSKYMRVSYQEDEIIIEIHFPYESLPSVTRLS